MTWLVRPATVADAEGIARVHIDGWQGAYRHIFPADFLEGLGNTLDERTEGWRQGLGGAGGTGRKPRRTGYSSPRRTTQSSDSSRAITPETRIVSAWAKSPQSTSRRPTGAAA